METQKIVNLLIVLIMIIQNLQERNGTLLTVNQNLIINKMMK